MKTQPTSNVGRRFQFGFRTLFVLTAAVATCCTVFKWLEQAVVLQIVFLFYVVPLCIYVVFRGPVILRQLYETRRRRVDSRRRLTVSVETIREQWAKKQADDAADSGM